MAKTCAGGVFESSRAVQSGRLLFVGDASRCDYYADVIYLRE